MNQFTLQKSTDQLPEKILPTLDRLYEEFRTLGVSLNAKIESLRYSVELQNSDKSDELTSMKNLRECVRSAADVVSTASSTLTVDMVERTPARYGSDFGDVFVKDVNEPMLRWISSNTVNEFEDMLPYPDPSEASTGDAITEHHSDSDSDIETEMIKALFTTAKRLKKDGDPLGAERKLRNCLTRLSARGSTASLISLKGAEASGVNRLEILKMMIDIYCTSEDWVKAKGAMVEKLSITERQVGKTNELYLWDNLQLADFMAKGNEYESAHLQGRRSLRGFKKLGEGGHRGYEECALFLIKLCKEQGKADEEDAYAALLGSHQAKLAGGYSPTQTNGSLSVQRPPSRTNNQVAAKAPEPQFSLEATEALEPGTDVPEPQLAPTADQEELIGVDENGLARGQATISSHDKDSILIAASSSNIHDVLDADFIPRMQAEDFQATGPAVASEGCTIAPDLISVRPAISVLEDFLSTLYISGPVHSQLQKASVDAIVSLSKEDLLDQFCQKNYGASPVYTIEHGAEHFQCYIQLGIGRSFSGPQCNTKLVARDRAIIGACQKYIPREVESLYKERKTRDPYSDKEVLPEIVSSAPSESVVDLTVHKYHNDVHSDQGSPRNSESRSIIVSDGNHSHVPDILNLASRHSMPDINLAEGTIVSIASPLTFLLPSASSALRWHRRTVSNSERSGILPSNLETAIESPVCTQSLTDWTDDAKMEHVNACLDDLPPQHKTRSSPLHITKYHGLPGEAGVWACSQCKSEGIELLKDICFTCKRHCDTQDPSSLNNFQRRPFDHFRPKITYLDLDLIKSVESNFLPLQRKVFLMGDAMCGKTWLARNILKTSKIMNYELTARSAWSGRTLERSTSIWDTAAFVKNVTVNGWSREFELNVHDFPGEQTLSRTRRGLYLNVRVLLICFDVSNIESLENVQEMVSVLLPWKSGLAADVR